MKRGPEYSAQCAIVSFLAMALDPRQAVCLAVPGGDGRMTLAPGYVAGTPDLLVIAKGRPPLFVEVKSPRGRLSTEQSNLARTLEDLDAGWALCRTPSDAEAACLDHGIKLRARVRA